MVLSCIRAEDLESLAQVTPPGSVFRILDTNSFTDIRGAFCYQSKRALAFWMKCNTVYDMEADEEHLQGKDILAGKASFCVLV